MKQIPFIGCCTALVTPFLPSGALDFATFERLVEDQLEAGVAALLCCGTTGEGSTLSEEEAAALIAACVRFARGRAPVIANVGSNDTAHSTRMAKRAFDAGADALLAITPYYNKTSQQGLLLHFKALAAAAPFIPQPAPCRVTSFPNTIAVRVG